MVSNIYWRFETNLRLPLIAKARSFLRIERSFMKVAQSTALVCLHFIGTKKRFIKPQSLCVKGFRVFILPQVK
jgi:hypothetical protein